MWNFIGGQPFRSSCWDIENVMSPARPPTTVWILALGKLLIKGHNKGFEIRTVFNDLFDSQLFKYGWVFRYTKLSSAFSGLSLQILFWFPLKHRVAGEIYPGSEQNIKSINVGQN
jgi:hypothetical protein